MIRVVLIVFLLLTAHAAHAAKYVFARGVDNALWYYDETEWRSLGGKLASAPDAASWDRERIDVFVRGTDNALWQISRVGGRWTRWVNLGGSIASGPSVASWGENRLDVVAQGTDRAMWHKAWDGSRWSGWRSLGGRFPAGASPDVASWGPNRLDVFARGADSSLWQAAFDGTEWSDWNRLSDSRITSDPGAVSWGPNRIDAFARGADGQMWQISWNGSEWTGWSEHGGQFPAASGPDATATAANRLEMYARGTDNAVWERDWNGEQWSDWKSLGGNVTSDPAAVIASDPARSLSTRADPTLVRPARVTDAVTTANVRPDARYRVTLNGFTVHHETWDDILERDGKRDEVFFVHQARLLDAGGAVIAAPEPMRSVVHGDVNRDDWRTSRVAAGSASAAGGLRAGDSFPTSAPWMRNVIGGADQVPAILWEGELRADQSVLVIPTLWEWDGEPDFLNRALSILGAPVVLAGEGLGLFLSAAPQQAADNSTALLAHVARRLTARGEIGTSVTVNKNVFGDAKDRPIGMRDSGSQYVYEPQALYLTADLAQRVSRTDFGRGAGVISLRYRDAEELKGDYTIYLQVERLR